MLEFEPNTIPEVYVKLYGVDNKLYETRLVVDTGAGSTLIIRPEIIEELGYDLTQYQTAEKGIVTGAGKINVINLQIEKVEALGIAKLSPVVRTYPFSKDLEKRNGFIGVKFLRDLSINFDFKNGKIKVETP